MVDTLGGLKHVRRDEGSATAPYGQPVFFAAFLGATRVFERGVTESTLTFRSGNAPDERDVLAR